jgi:23S rRNA (uracil1939-C5)-methyltransferase
MSKRRKGSRDVRRRLSNRAPPVEVTVGQIGARGDGVAAAESDSRDIGQHHAMFIPLSLPGERVMARPVSDTGEGIASQLLEIIRVSPDRIEPACPNFGACGGCGLQHWAEAPYRQWKRERVVTAIHRAGFHAAQIDALVTTAPGSRIRADFVMRRLATGVVLGFHERGSNRIVDIRECPILEAGLMIVAGGLREMAERFLDPGESARATVNILDSGPDLLLMLPREPNLVALETLAAMAEAADLCRIATTTGTGRDQGLAIPLLERRVPIIRFAGVEVTPPPGAFLQATRRGANAITDAVLAGIGPASRIVELHAGCGTLSFPLHQRGRLHAVEGDPAATAALGAAATRAGLGGSFTVETRDLMDRPLEPPELAAYDALVFDPPRAGARAQAERIAAGGPGRVAAVSCNPATFTRDARILAEAGYTLDRVIPIDQFLWSPHVELVAHFRRGEPA